MARLRQFFDQAGIWAPLLYVAFVIVEVIIAPIPGIMLYAPGGLIFGPWLGGSLALIGNVIGAGISCGLTRSLGSSWLDRISSGTAMSRLQTALEKDGSRLIVMLRLNPLTSTDLLSYAAGFTRIPIHRVMLATGIGMAPLCVFCNHGCLTVSSTNGRGCSGRCWVSASFISWLCLLSSFVCCGPGNTVDL